MTNIDPAIVEALAEALPDALRPVGAGLKNLPGTFRNQNTATERLTGYGQQLVDAIAPLIAAAVDAARAEGDKQGAARVREAVEAVLDRFDRWPIDDDFVGLAPTEDIRAALTEAAPHD